MYEQFQNIMKMGPFSQIMVSLKTLDDKTEFMKQVIKTKINKAETIAFSTEHNRFFFRLNNVHCFTEHDTRLGWRLDDEGQ